MKHTTTLRLLGTVIIVVLALVVVVLHLVGAENLVQSTTELILIVVSVVGTIAFQLIIWPDRFLREESRSERIAGREFSLPTADQTCGHGSDYQHGTVGEKVAFGDALCFKDDGKYWQADARTSTTMPVIALAIEPKDAGQTCGLLMKGYARDDSWNWTTARPLFMSATAGSMTQKLPSGSGNEVQYLGRAVRPTIIFFEPEKVMVTIA